MAGEIRFGTTDAPVALSTEEWLAATELEMAKLERDFIEDFTPKARALLEAANDA